MSEKPGNAKPQLGEKTDRAKLGLGVPSVPHGYKLTEVGVIPVEWEVKTLGEIATFLGAAAIPAGRLAGVLRNGKALSRTVANISSGKVCLKRDQRMMWPLNCLLYTSPSPRDGLLSRMPSSA